MKYAKAYVVYDTKHDEQCIGIFDSPQQLAKMFKLKEASVNSMITKKCKLKHRYIVERLYEEDL